MRLACAVLFFIAIVGVLGETKKVIDFPDCAYQRADVINCGIKYIDLNHDMTIDLYEIIEARTYLKWWERAIAWLGESPETSLANCGGTAKGYISIEDFETHKDTCLNNCFKTTLAMERVCLRAAAAAEEEAKLASVTIKH